MMKKGLIILLLFYFVLDCIESDIHYFSYQYRIEHVWQAPKSNENTNIQKGKILDIPFLFSLLIAKVLNGQDSDLIAQLLGKEYVQSQSCKELKSTLIAQQLLKGFIFFSGYQHHVREDTSPPPEQV